MTSFFGDWKYIRLSYNGNQYMVRYTLVDGQPKIDKVEVRIVVRYMRVMKASIAPHWRTVRSQKTKDALAKLIQEAQ